jgi:hypothetical protein
LDVRFCRARDQDSEGALSRNPKALAPHARLTDPGFTGDQERGGTRLDIVEEARDAGDLDPSTN